MARRFRTSIPAKVPSLLRREQFPAPLQHLATDGHQSASGVDAVAREELGQEEQVFDVAVVLGEVPQPCLPIPTRCEQPVRAYFGCAGLLKNSAISGSFRPTALRLSDSNLH